MNKKILITGASGGIGKALCNAFANENNTVFLHYNSNKGRAESVLNQLPGSNHQTVQADLSKPDQISAMFDLIKVIDVVVNNAAVVEPHILDQLKFDEWTHIWRKTIDTNLIGLSLIHI